MEMLKLKIHFAFCNRTLTYISAENEGVIDDYYKLMELEVKKDEKKKKGADVSSFNTTQCLVVILSSNYFFEREIGR